MKEVTIWAETEAEIQDFLEEFGDSIDFIVKEVFVAKKSGKKRAVGHRYLDGIYYPYDLNFQATLDETVKAPDFIEELVQWCSPDIIIADDNKAILSIELTYHVLTFNNIAQRIPRLVKSASKGVPSVIFQKVNYEEDILINWYLKTFLKTTVIYQTPCLAVVFDDDNFIEAKKTLVELMNDSVENVAEEIIDRCIETMQMDSENYDEHTLTHDRRSKKRNWVEVADDEVFVNIGVRDNCALTRIPGYGCQGDKESQTEFRKKLKSRPSGAKGCVWLSKGTGGMDPYPGLVKMVEILLCYNEQGIKDKRLVTYFACLPEDFWWFEKNKNELYYKLVLEFSDEVLYSEDYK